MSRPDLSSPPDPDRLGLALQTVVVWTRTADVEELYCAVVDGRAWALRLGEFPAEPLYTLIVDGEAVGSFDTWPKSWARPPT